MKYESIADIFSANTKIREGLEIVLGGISPDEAAIRPDDGGVDYPTRSSSTSRSSSGRTGEVCIETA